MKQVPYLVHALFSYFCVVLVVVGFCLSVYDVYWFLYISGVALSGLLGHLQNIVYGEYEVVRKL